MTGKVALSVASRMCSHGLASVVKFATRARSVCSTRVAWSLLMIDARVARDEKVSGHRAVFDDRADTSLLGS